MNRFAPRKRSSIRRAVIILLLYLSALGASWALSLAGSTSWGSNLQALAEALALIALLNLAGLALFDLGLPRIGVEVATIITDLAMGGAYVLATLGVLRHAGLDLSGIVTTSAVVTGILALSLQSTASKVAFARSAGVTR